MTQILEFLMPLIIGFVGSILGFNYMLRRSINPNETILDNGFSDIADKISIKDNSSHKSLKPRYSYSNGKWKDVSKCNQCNTVGQYPEMSTVEPCGNCGTYGNISIVGRWDGNQWILK